MDEQDSHEFRDSPLAVVLGAFAAVVGAMYGRYMLASGERVLGVLSLATAALWLLGSIWDGVRPYVRTTASGITVFPGIFRRRRVSTWDAFEEVRPVGWNSLEFRLRGGTKIKIRLDNLRVRDRALLASDIERMRQSAVVNDGSPTDGSHVT